jgi:hypothetical protein
MSREAYIERMAGCWIRRERVERESDDRRMLRLA